MIIYSLLLFTVHSLGFGKRFWCWICWNSHWRGSAWFREHRHFFHTENLATSAWVFPLTSISFQWTFYCGYYGQWEGFCDFLFVSLESNSPRPAPWIGNGFFCCRSIFLNLSFYLRTFLFVCELEEAQQLASATQHFCAPAMVKVIDLHLPRLIQGPMLL